jgi:hypothetical protein
MKAEEYLKTNHIVSNFIDKVNSEIKEYYKVNFPNLKPELLSITVGNKFIKLVSVNRVWGFISRYDGLYKNVPIKKGDLLMPASYSSPAKHSRGNIIDGTAAYTTYGPVYLK